MKELRECPFCGSKDVKVAQDNYSPMSIYIAYCQDCGASGRLALTEEGAATAWNRRADDPRKTVSKKRWLPGPPRYYRRGDYEVWIDQSDWWRVYCGIHQPDCKFETPEGAMAFCDEHERKMKEESEK